MWHLAPENDYRTLRDVPVPAPQLRVAVCMPVYNRVDLLARTVAALVPQTYPHHLLEVAIGDDGSDEDVEAAVAPFRDRLSISVHRRERDGFGAGQARNLAARSTDADVLVFVDGDCLPDRDLVLRHAEWHHRAENLIVIGSRHRLDTSVYDLDLLSAGVADLRIGAFGTETPSAAQVASTDHRSRLHRRTGGQRRGDEAYRSLVSSNFSIRRDRFLEVGGFDETFHRWGGEDVELGWRCHVAGHFTVVEDAAIVFHQTQEDLWADDGREQSRATNAGVIQNKIPHGFYRKYRHEHIWEVPKVSVVVLPLVESRLDELADQMRRQVYTDWEMVVPGGTPATTLFGEFNQHDPRFTVTAGSDPLQALRAARGEYLMVVNGDVALEPRLLTGLVRPLERKRRASATTIAYLVDGAVVRRADDRADLDAAWDLAGLGLPLCHLARRREWSKALHGAGDVAEAFATVVELSTTIEVAEARVAVRSARPDDTVGDPHPAFTAPRTVLRREVTGAASPQAALLAAGKFIRRRTYVPDPAPRPPKVKHEGRPTVRYVGWTGHDNLGDEALLAAVAAELGWGEVRTSGPGDLLLLGGGTLINRGSYLSWLAEQDSPRIERAVFGTGVANPEFWGEPADRQGWVDWLDTCGYIGVRGPDSAAVLEKWGVSAPFEVVGDAALALRPVAERVEGRVVVAPCRTRDELWGSSDDAVFSRLGDLTRALAARGHEVVMLACHPDDDGPCLQIMRRAGLPDLPYRAGYADLDAAMALLASADLVVAERLHAAVLGAAGGTPFVALEYRPKVRDFARSVGFDDRTLRTDDLGGLEEITFATLADLIPAGELLATRVEEYRMRLSRAAASLRHLMGV